MNTLTARNETRPAYGNDVKAPDNDDATIAQALKILARRLRKPGPAR